MSIATKAGDTGKTGLIGGERVSKADARVEAYGTIDELTSVMGFARSICDDAEVRELTKGIQRELFVVSGSVANPASNEASPNMYVTPQMVEALSAHVRSIESTEGLLSDWSLPGEHAAAASYDVARTVCRRAERAVVRLAEQGGAVGEHVVPYLNRLSDLLWLLGRLLELRAGINARLRDDEHEGPRWSRAW
ncbi:MAG TPA: cob(I)yrinic acid a,c-diamide adenosyltransferase [Pyrinomonadaceae bacterium]|jgi:cob(I)alamin adenosyltransferase|nr:cob(I)yrinic acid a,c-diamide adenosyltransferase [Pyrinomonadaceae bacterium]